MSPQPQIDHLVPSFKMKDSQGHLLSPDVFLGHPYVIYFYPKDDTPGCTKQACDLRDNRSILDQIQARIIGISPDSEASHDKFISKYSLNFSLVSDPLHELCRLFDVWQENKTNDQIKWSVIRTTFVVDTKGIIRWIEKPVQVEGHAERVLQALKNLPKASAPL